MTNAFGKTRLAASAETILPLEEGWHFASTNPSVVVAPSDLSSLVLEWMPAIVPGTVAQSLQMAGRWDIDQLRDFDDGDWWYRCRFNNGLLTQGDRQFLRFAGLATLAEVWLNGENILISNNMFHQHELEVTQLLRATNELYICFRSLNAALEQKRPRPRWKTKLVSHQQLRWFRTTLLGRIPGWSPPIAPVGPWKAIGLETHTRATITEINLRSSLQGDVGVVDFDCMVHAGDDTEISAYLSVAGHRAKLKIEKVTHGYCLHGELRVPEVPLWWPHTHGEPVLHGCGIDISTSGQTMSVDCGKIGFRHISVNDIEGAFALMVNGQAVFCRGACWTVNDMVSLKGSARSLASSLRLARDAGMNMVRVGGTMLYEDESFYSLCDELGILVWQDFMFANMDYPIDDERFRASVDLEVTQQLKRWRSHPCMAVYCGNSEVEQQASMLGMSKELWRNALFATVLPDLCRRWHPEIHYIPSTPSGGVLPFHTGTGVTHYYGVGAYQRPMSDVRRANVRFTPECLGFSNVPEPETVSLVMNGLVPVTHHPRWKERVPRDTGAGWDFEDIRDHYTDRLFSISAVQLRTCDTGRYLTLSRVTSGEVMSQVFSEWRSAYSRCRGGLVWFFKDLWPGAGWGILDSGGSPKACFYYLRRVWQNQVVVLTDEGLDGVHAHVINEADVMLIGTIEFVILSAGQVVIAKGERPIQINPRATITIGSDDVLNGFFDVTYAYRFGPPKHDVVAVTLRDNHGVAISEAFHFPRVQEPRATSNVNIIAEAEAKQDGAYQLTLQTDHFLYSVHFDVDDFMADNNYFHLMPGRQKHIIFSPKTEQKMKFKGYIEALNLHESMRITVKE
jgi:beta-mannosidase